MAKYIVRLKTESKTPQYYTDRKEEFTDMDEAKKYAYHLLVSNFDNPSELPVLVNGKRYSPLTNENEWKWK